jgi:spermidine/putrescine transport system substrate-binding protein
MIKKISWGSRSMSILLIVLLFAMMSAGCGAQGTEAGGGNGSGGTGDGQGEKASGELNLFTWDGMFPQEVLDGFEKETGIRINYSNFIYDEDMLAKLEETEGGAYDLVIADDYIIEVVIGQGLAQKLDTAKIGSYQNINQRFMSQFYDPANEYTVPYGAGIPLIVYDPALAGIEIGGYEDLLNPALVDNVAITANYRVINGIGLKLLGESYNTNDLEVIRRAGDKMLEMAPNIRVIDDSNTQDFLISGEVAAAFLYTSQVYLAMNSRDDLEIAYPKEGLGYGIMAAFIPSKAPNAGAAYAFLDYINRPENASQCFEFLGYYCTNKAAEGYISEEIRPLIVLPEDAASGEVIQNISAEADELHLRIWDEFRNACD